MRSKNDSAEQIAAKCKRDPQSGRFGEGIALIGMFVELVMENLIYEPDRRVVDSYYARADGAVDRNPSGFSLSLYVELDANPGFIRGGCDEFDTHEYSLIGNKGAYLLILDRLRQFLVMYWAFHG
jgi:hypothetical protein